MFWVACLAVLLAATRYSGRFAAVVIGVLAGLVLAWELPSTLILLVSGERPRLVFWPKANRLIPTRSDLWAFADGCPIRVELLSLQPAAIEQVEVQRVVDWTIGARTHLCTVAGTTVEPLNLTDRRPLLIWHKTYGICWAQPVSQP
jgi:hypothetical protein